MSSMTREMVEALLVTVPGVPYEHAHRQVLIHDAAQRATIEAQAQRIQELERELMKLRVVIDRWTSSTNAT